ncbi:hypothetical protein DXT94_30595 [Rhizobium sp. ICMP 5592]|nr:hypothetical protein [Rhizobium sp. ICMP 5592]
MNLEDLILQHAAPILSHDEANAIHAVVPPIVQTSRLMLSSYKEMVSTYRGEMSREVYTRGLVPRFDMLAKLKGAEDSFGFASGIAAAGAAPPP